MKLGKGYCNGQKKSNSKYAVDRYGVNLEKEVSADTFYKRFLLESDCLNEKEKDDFHKISADMENYLAAGPLMPCPVICCAIMAKRSLFCWMSMTRPCRRLMCMATGMKQWNLCAICSMPHFKTNPYLDRAIMTGITRVSKESILAILMPAAALPERNRNVFIMGSCWG